VEGDGGRPLVAGAGRGADGGRVGQGARDPENGRGEKEAEPHGILLTYKDGFRATVLKVGRSSTRWNVALRPNGEKGVMTLRYYVGPWKNRNLFKALAHAI
jgi:hypothetical protein